MEIRLYVQILKRGWWIIVLSVLAAFNTALLVSYLSPSVYEATSRFIVSPNVSVFSNSSDVNSSMDTLDRRSIINTYKELLASPSVYGSHPLIAAIPAADFQKSFTIKAVVIPDTNILQLTVDGYDAEAVTSVAKAIEEKSTEYINKLYPVYNFTILDSASVPTEPILPKPIQNASLALVIGLFLGVGLAFLQDQLQNTIDSLRVRSSIDQTTSAYNRSFFEKSIVQEISRNPTGILSLGIISFTGLDEVIDILPQSMIQKVMRQVSLTLKEELRSHDIVGRWDKTRLAVLLPTTPGTAARNTLIRIQKLLSTPISLDGVNEMVIYPGPCIGISEKGPEETLSAEIIGHAEAALANAVVLENSSVILYEDLDHTVGGEA